MGRLDQFLGWAVIWLPIVLSVAFIFVPARSEDARQNMRWRYWLVAVAVVLGALSWWEQSRAVRASANDRENAIKETSQQVAATTSAAVTRTVTDLYSQMISDQKSQIAQLQNALAAQGKDVNTIKSSNIVTGKSPIKVEVTNGTPQSNQEWAFSKDKENAFVSRIKGVAATFQIQAAVDDPESFRFAEQLDALLKQAGWTEVGGVSRGRCMVAGLRA